MLDQELYDKLHGWLSQGLRVGYKTPGGRLVSGYITSMGIRVHDKKILVSIQQDGKLDPIRADPTLLELVPEKEKPAPLDNHVFTEMEGDILRALYPGWMNMTYSYVQWVLEHRGIFYELDDIKKCLKKLRRLGFVESCQHDYDLRKIEYTLTEAGKYALASRVPGGRGVWKKGKFLGTNLEVDS